MDWYEILIVYFLSTVKFFFGGVMAAPSFGFSHFQSIVVTSLGGFTGVTVFVYASDKLILWFRKRREEKRRKNPNLPVKKVFTKKNRNIITIKNKFGLVGFSFLVPVFIPIPIGCFLTVRYFNDKGKIIRYLFVSVLFWSIVGAYFYTPIVNAIRNYFL